MTVVLQVVMFTDIHEPDLYLWGCVTNRSIAGHGENTSLTHIWMYCVYEPCPLLCLLSQTFPFHSGKNYSRESQSIIFSQPGLWLVV